MADNVTINVGSGGDSVAADDIAGVKYQRVKIVHGADGFNDGDVATANGLPVQAATAFPVTDNGGSLTVDGTVAITAASLPSHDVTNAGTFAVQASQAGTWDVTNISGTVSLPTGAATAAKQPALGTAGTAASDVITIQGITGMTAVKVDGSAVTQPVSGTFWQATQPVSIASSVPVTDNSGSLTVDAPVGTPVFVRLSDGTAAISTLPVSLASVPSHAVTNAGTFAVQAAQSGTWNVTNISGTVSLPTGASTAANQATANTSLASIDGKIPALGQALAASSVPVVLTANQLSTLTPLSSITVSNFPSTQAVSGTVTANAGTGTFAVSAASLPLPSGAATAAKQPALGTAGTASTDVVTVQGIASMTALKVDGSAVTQPVSGTFWQTTQPVSIASSVPVTDNSGSLTVDAPVGTPVFVRLSDGTAAISTLPVSLASVPSHAVTNAGTFAVQAAQSGTWNVTNISGTVSLPTGASTAANQATANTSLASIDGKIPALGQALAASSVPVVLTANQLSTLTPLSSISVSNFPSTQAVSGTVTANAGTGTFAVSAASLPLPSGAATAAKQPAIGTAGTASTDVLTVQGIASMTALKVDGSAVTQPVSGTFWQATQPVSLSSVPSHNVTNAGTFAVQATVAAGATNIAKAEDVASADADVGVPAMAVRKATPANTSGTDGDYEMLQMSAGRLWVDASGVTLTVGSHAVTNAGTFAVQAAQSGTWTVQPGNTANTTAWLVTGTGGTFPVTDSGGSLTVDAPVGTPVFVRLSDGSSAISTLTVNDAPTTSGGLSVSSFLSTAAVQSTAIKASAGMVYAIEFFNNSATPVYVRLYNQTTAPASTDTGNIVWRGMVPGNTAGSGFVKSWDKGLTFSTGIGMRCTGAIADNDTTALSANTIVGNVDYK